MQPGEVVVARLARGASLVRFVEQAQSRVTVALGRNREARLPHDRILLWTGTVAASHEELEELRLKCEDLASDIDLSELWEVAGDEAAPVSLDSLAELYWGSAPDAAHRAALTLHLERGSDYFVHGKDGYTTRPRASLEEIQARRRREAESEQAAASLMQSLSKESLPEQMTRPQEDLLQHLRDYAIHGEDSARSSTARGLVQTVSEATKDLQRQCFEMLAASGVFSPDEPLELHRAGIREKFPKDAVAESDSIELEGLLADPVRRDLTALAAITIDDVEAEDRDDALSLEVEEADPDSSSGGFRIGIHIADGGSLIPQGGAIDREADRRMASLYLPERTIGMLPPGFSRRVGSLEPGENRVSVSLLVHVTLSGEVSEWEVTPSVARSQAALTYEDADRAIEDESSPWHRMLSHLNRAARALRHRREAAGAVNIEQGEMAIKVEPSGEVQVRVLQRTAPARQMVAELMILTNSLLAEFCRRERLPAVYRTQAASNLSDVTGTEVPKGPVPPAPAPSESGAEGALRRYLITRRLLPAEVDIIPARHHGLGVPAYIQGTSPLRRYPDLVMQRQISYFLTSGKPFYPSDAIESVVQRAEVQLREVARLEEERKRYWFLKYLQQSRLEGTQSENGPELFHAVVLENEPRRKALLELAKFPFRTRAELPRAYMPGDTATLKLQGVDLWRRAGYFVHVPSVE